MNLDFDSTHPMQDDAVLAPVLERIFVLMCGVTAFAVGVSLIFASWRVTSGLLLGGVLSLVNYHWMRSTVRGVFSNVEASGERPHWGASRYFFRYFFLAGVIAAAYWLDLVSLLAVLAGLSSFAAAGMIEGLIQFYFAIIKGRET